LVDLHDEAASGEHRDLEVGRDWRALCVGAVSLRPDVSEVHLVEVGIVRPQEDDVAHPDERGLNHRGGRVRLVVGHHDRLDRRDPGVRVVGERDARDLDRARLVARGAARRSERDHEVSGGVAVEDDDVAH
jgi:hypothetical protein